MEICFAYCKSSEFDPTKPLRIQFANQPTIDRGAPRRQFFTSISHLTIQKLFEGTQGNMLPRISANTNLCEIHVAEGKIITYTLVYGCEKNKQFFKFIAGTTNFFPIAKAKN